MRKNIILHHINILCAKRTLFIAVSTNIDLFCPPTIVSLFFNAEREVFLLLLPFFVFVNLLVVMDGGQDVQQLLIGLTVDSSFLC